MANWNAATIVEKKTVEALVRGDWVRVQPVFGLDSGDWPETPARGKQHFEQVAAVYNIGPGSSYEVLTEDGGVFNGPATAPVYVLAGSGTITV